MKFVIFCTMITLITDNVMSSCTNMFYIEYNTHHGVKYDSKIPSIRWRDRIVNQGIGRSIFEEVDFNKYELMTHAYSAHKGIIIHRICEKNGNYHKYGTITRDKIRGFTLSIRDIDNFDMFLCGNHYTSNTLSYRQYLYLKNKQYDDYVETFKREYPIQSFIKYTIPSTIKYFILGYCVRFLYFVFISSL